MTTDNFGGKSIFVVGAGSGDGIGFAAAQMLANNGADIGIADLARSDVLRLSGDLSGPAQHSAHVLDVTDDQSIQSAVDAFCETHSKIDGAVIASGVYLPESFLAASRNVWERAFAINTIGAASVAKTIAEKMIASGGGSIVLVASINGLLPTMSAAAYGVSKAATIHLGRYMALELAKYSVTVNVLCPGSTATSMMGTDPKRLDAAVRGSIEQWRLGIPLGRLAEPSEQAAAIAFLLGDGARHITGQTLNVDGGQTFF